MKNIIGYYLEITLGVILTLAALFAVSGGAFMLSAAFFGVKPAVFIACAVTTYVIMYNIVSES